MTEVFESLIQVAADDRTAAGLRAGGNGEAQGPTPGDLQEISQELFEALKGLSGDELDTDNLELIAVDLEQRAAEAREHFEARSAEFTPRPVGKDEPIAVAGMLFTGLSDAAGLTYPQLSLAGASILGNIEKRRLLNPTLT